MAFSVPKKKYMEKARNFGFIVFQRKSPEKAFVFLLLLIGFSACNPFQANKLNQLGRSHDYDDVSIPADFDEKDGNAYSRKVSSREMFLKSLNAPAVTTFKVETKEFKLAHNRALRWNGCSLSQEAMGGPSNRCGDAFLEGDFHRNLNLSFGQCVRNAAGTAGYPEPVRFFIQHVGTYSNRRIRNGRELSLHARARAMDIVRFHLFNREGVRYVVSADKRHYRGKQAVFYDEFRDCWRASLPGNCAFSQRGEHLGSIGHPASKLGGDSLHNDHLHLSFPLCATEV